MANEDADEFDQVDVVPVVEDSSRGLTNGLVFMTSLVLLVAIILTMLAMAKWFGRGMFA